MKKVICFIAALLFILLCACSHTDKIIGTWEGDAALFAPEGPAVTQIHTLTFREDGTGYVLAAEGNLDFTYALTDDTLTFRFGELGVGISYSISGDSLILRKDFVFERADGKEEK